MKLLRTASVLVLAAFALTACDEDTTGVEVADLEGAWEAIQYQYSDNTSPLSVDVINDLNGTLTIDVAADGSFEGSINIPNVTEQALPIAGTFSISGDSLSVNFSDQTESYGLVSDFDAIFDLTGNVLTFTNSDVSYDFPDTIEAGAGMDPRGEVSAAVSVELNR